MREELRKKENEREREVKSICTESVWGWVDAKGGKLGKFSGQK